MKMLIVGDPHATPDSIDEMERLMDFVIKTALEQKVNMVVLTGDQYHTHSIIHLSVQAFWSRTFKKMEKLGLLTVALVGNHDRSGNHSHSYESAMSVHEDNVRVVNAPQTISGILFIPYIHDGEYFVKLCNGVPHRKTVICHQTFDGSKYENGFYAKEGIDASLIPQTQIISGHIHAPQELGKVWYVGAPRWRTVSDANTERAIWLVEHDATGTILNRTPFDTSKVCTPIWNVTDSPESQVVWVPAGKVTVDIHGPVDYINERVKHFTELGYRIRTFPEKNFTSEVKESEGVSIAFTRFIQGYVPKNGTPQDKLLKLTKERVKWMAI